jgi:hypothetical protein
MLLGFRLLPALYLLVKIKALIDSRKDVMMIAATLNSNFIGRDYWRDKAEYERMPTQIFKSL